MISDKTKERWAEIIEAAELRADLTDWEQEFIDSIGIQLGGGKELTRKQTACLYKIAEKYGL